MPILAAISVHCVQQFSVLGIATACLTGRADVFKMVLNAGKARGWAMAETDRWLSEYGESHADMTFPIVYWLAVPGIVIGTVGMLWSLPVPVEFVDISPVLNWGSAFLMAAVVYYFIISIPLAIGMLPFVAGLSALEFWLAGSPFPLGWFASGLIVASIVGLYLGHYRNGGVRAVFVDVQLMMIAPVWLLSNLYRRLGIPV